MTQTLATPLTFQFYFNSKRINNEINNEQKQLCKGKYQGTTVIIPPKNFQTINSESSYLHKINLEENSQRHRKEKSIKLYCSQKKEAQECL